MGYIPPQSIDVGVAAINRGSYGTVGSTYYNKGNPANASGKITSVDVWTYVTMTTASIGIFYNSGGLIYTRDYEVIGTVTSGAKRTFSVDLNIQAGDFIGIHASNGQIERDLSGGSDICGKSGDHIPCSGVTFTTYSGDSISVYGTGTTGSGELTIGEAFSTVDSLIKSAAENLSEAFSIVDSKVTKIVKSLSEAFSAVDSWVVRINLSETFSIADSLVKNAVKNLAETLQTVDSFAYTVFLYFYETLSVRDSFKRFFYNLYTKVTKGLSTYTKINKDTSTYTKIDKSDSDYTKKDKERGEEF